MKVTVQLKYDTAVEILEILRSLDPDPEPDEEPCQLEKELAEAINQTKKTLPKGVYICPTCNKPANLNHIAACGLPPAP